MEMEQDPDFERALEAATVDPTGARLADLAFEIRMLENFWMGLETDRDGRIRWYESAARHGHYVLELAEALVTRNDPGDLDAAVAWLEPRAEQGDLAAIHLLMQVLSRRGTPKDHAARRFWKRRFKRLEAAA